ncbi:MAG: TRAP transporter small permease [Burkholderiales bacterium]
MTAMTRIFRWCYDLAGISLVFLMAITVTDIAARNLGLFSMRGIVELSTMAVVLIGFLALPYSFHLGGHIIVDLATMRLGKPTNRRIDAFWLVAAAVCLGFVAYLMWGATAKAYRTNDLSLDLQLPMVVFWLPASLGMTLAPIACVWTAVSMLRMPDRDQGD